MNREQASVTQRWVYVSVVLGAAVGMFAGFPPLFNATAGVFMQPLSAEFGWGRSETALSYSSSMLGLALVCPLVGNFMDRFGCRKVILFSSILFGLAVAAMSFQSGSKAMWIGLSLMIGMLGAATSVLGYLAILPQWFDRRLGLALAFAMCGLGLGTIVMPTFAQHLISSFGWRTAYVILGLVSIFFSVVAFFLLRERGPARNKNIQHSGAAVDVSGMSVREGLCSWRLWTIFFVFLIASMATLSLNPHLPSLFGDKGFSRDMAARAASMAGIGLISGRLVTGIMLDRVHAPYVACFFFLVGACGLFLLSETSSYPLMLGASVMIGLTIGAEGDLISYLTRSYFGMRAFGTLYGISFAGYALGGVIGPVVVGRFFDLHKNYELVLTVFPWLLAGAGVGMLSLGRYRNSSTNAQDRGLKAA